jgi:hypothetical protein
MYPVFANYSEAIPPGKSLNEMAVFLTDVNFLEKYVLLVLDHM